MGVINARSARIAQSGCHSQIAFLPLGLLCPIARPSSRHHGCTHRVGWPSAGNLAATAEALGHRQSTSPPETLDHDRRASGSRPPRSFGLAGDSVDRGGPEHTLSSYPSRRVPHQGRFSPGPQEFLSWHKTSNVAPLPAGLGGTRRNSNSWA